MSVNKKKLVDSTKVAFHGVLSASLSAGGAAQYQGSPTGFAGRMLAEADAWAHFRLLSLSFRLQNADNTATLMSAGWCGGAQDTLPNTAVAVMELLPSVYYSGLYTRPSDWVQVRKEDLAGPLPWYKTINGTADVTEETPGFLVLFGTVSKVYALEYRALVEFKTAVSTGNTPMQIRLTEIVRREKLLAAREKERDGLLRILGQRGSTVVVPAAAEVKSSQLPPTGAGCGMPYLKPELCDRQSCPYHPKP